MAAAFNYAKVVSNTVLLKLEADDKFLEYLRNNIKNNFSSSIILRRSVFIFSRENERHRRKIFLTWAANLFSKELLPYKGSLLNWLLKHCDLPINIQILTKNQLVTVKKSYVYFANDTVSIKCFSKQATLFSYIKALLRQECDMDESLYELRLYGISANAKNKLKHVLTRKLFLGLDSFESFYSKMDFEKFFAQDFKHTFFAHEDEDRQRKNRMLSILGVKDELTSNTLKKRYHELAKLYHPDLHAQKSESEKALLSLQFLKVKEAYETLCRYVA